MGRRASRSPPPSARPTGNGGAAILVAADVSGAVDERAARLRGTAGAGHIGLGLGLDALGESPRFGFRLGATLTGRVVRFRAAPPPAPSAAASRLPVVHADHPAVHPPVAANP